jgi:two-component system, NarL family, sensor histidine kinase DesK
MVQPVASGGEALFEVRDPTRLTLRRWYRMTGAWALLLVPQVWVVATAEQPVPVRALLTVAVLGYIACFVHGLYLALTRRRAVLSVALIAVMFSLWSVNLVGQGPQSLSGFYTVSFLLVAVAVLTPIRYSAAATLLTCAAALAVGWVAGHGLDWSDVFTMFALGLAMIAMFWLIRINTQLRVAREELATMAVAADRERMARDLHDVLGHSLTTITVKAGLARRLLEQDEPERAAVEVTDIERLGRQTLADVRSTVSANRVASLANELAGAREALRAAEIDADLPHAVDDVPADRQQVFAFVVREGVTNTIRHSGAGTCTIRLTPDSVEVLDDGLGPPVGTPLGNGLTGLRERLAAVGGRIEAGPGPTGGFRLRAECT